MRKAPKPSRGKAEWNEPYLEAWRSLSPGERLRRSWRLRSRLKNPRAIHDAKTFPEL